MKYYGRDLYIFLNNKWHFDSIYNYYIVKPLMFWGHNISYKVLDRGLIEYVGPQGIILVLRRLGKWISSLQSGYVYNYAFAIFIGTTIYLLLISNIEIYNNMEIIGILPVFAYILHPKS